MGFMIMFSDTYTGSFNNKHRNIENPGFFSGNVTSSCYHLMTV
jgi:hypothetical protein